MRDHKRDEWEIRDDARTLARAAEIKADKERHAQAVDMAKKMADEEMKRISAIRKVAGTKVSVTTNSSGTNDLFHDSISKARVSR